MTDILYSIDRTVLLFINSTLANAVGDVLWPAITNYDRFLPVRIVLLIVWLWLIIRGGVRGRTAALMIIPVLFAADKLSSIVVKDLVDRLRPCHQIDGITVVQGLHMLVDCGPGKAFPSSHAVNNFAAATVFARCFPRGRWWFFAWAALVATSRVAVGVHYPSDVVGGGVLGCVVALACLTAWMMIQKRYFPSLSLQSSEGASLGGHDDAANPH